MVENENDACFDFDEGRLEVKLELRLPGEVGAIGPVVETIMAVVRDTSCAAGSEFEVEVALTEAIANAVRHGCGEDPRKEVEIAVACEPEKGMLVVVRDPGEGFDPAEIANPVEADNVFRSHGRGVFLISQLMDEVEYLHGGTEVRMRKHGRRST